MVLEVLRGTAKSRNRWIPAAICLILMASGCSGPAPSRGEEEQPRESSPSRTLVIIAREIPTLAAKPLQGVSGSARGHIGLFNATLTARGEAGNPVPQLVEALPQLNTESWRVFPDGSMETTYRLRPNLTWQDGQPLSAQDFVFAGRVYVTPDFGQTGPPVRPMEEVRALDARTLLIRWREPYPEAGQLDTNFPPLPRHILERSFEEVDPTGFVGLPFWVNEYVGLGPYRVDRYEPGAWLEAVAFHGYVWGRPKIDRAQVAFILDPNTAVAHMMAGEAHYITDFIIGPDDARTLEQQWHARGQAGVILETPSQIRFTSFQFRLEVMNPPEMGDVRVRKAIAHAIDNEASLEAITYGKGKLVSVPIPNDEVFWPIFEGFPRHGFDPRKTHQLLEEAGFARSADGFYRSLSRGPFRFEFGFISQASNERENAIWVDNLRRVGLDASSRGYVQAQIRGEGRASFPALFTGSGTRLANLGLDTIPTPQNRWQGANYGSWRHEEYDRLVKAFEVTLEPRRREQLLLDMGRLYHEHLPGLAHYLTPIVNAWVGDLVNVPARTELPRVNSIDYIHRWNWRS